MDLVVETEGIKIFTHAKMNQEDLCPIDAIIPSLNQNHANANHDTMNVSPKTATHAPMTVNLIVDPFDEIKGYVFDIMIFIRAKFV